MPSSYDLGDNEENTRRVLQRAEEHIQSLEPYQPSHWSRWYGQIVRWIVYIPIILIALTLFTIAGPLVLFGLSKVAFHHVELNVLSVLLFVVFGPVALWLAWFAICFYFVGMCRVTQIGCQNIAPHPQIGSVIFGTIYGLCFIVGMVMYSLDQDWGNIAWQVSIAVPVFWGVQAAFREMEG